MKYFILILTISFLLGCNSKPKETGIAMQNQPTEVEVKDGVFIHITSGFENPHRVLMPLKMATMMAKDKDVLIYMDIDAVNLLVKEAEDLEMDGFDSFQSYIDQLKSMSVQIMACPTCLEIAGFSSEDLKEGVMVAQKERFFNFTKGRIITLDY